MGACAASYLAYQGDPGVDAFVNERDGPDFYRKGGAVPDAVCPGLEVLAVDGLQGLYFLALGEGVVDLHVVLWGSGWVGWMMLLLLGYWVGD